VHPEFEARIATIASDRESGASEILVEAIAILRDALASGEPIRPIARGLSRAQPSMASVWNATIEALVADDGAARLEQFATRVTRAPEAMARYAAEALPDAPMLRLVTISFSGSVAHVLEVLHRRRKMRVACSESRPALEGRRLASRLAGLGIPVTCYSDAAIGQALGSADAVIVGADAVGPEWVLNKSGTRMLAAAAMQQGIPVYVVASRDKFVARTVGARLVAKEGATSEIWFAPPPGVTVRNPYFEPTPLDLIASVISDVGVLGADMVPDVCESAHDAFALEALKDL
jgi:translation initiation factor 2B subunit (eIF-2B alpha/beta/delta family)